jgi:hypothetical protein
MPRANIQGLHEAIEGGACDAATIAALAACVAEQGVEGYYDYEINKYLLKMYTCEPQRLDLQQVASILVLAMMRLPGKDLLAFQLMIPLSYENDARVKTVMDCVRTLESGHFQKFWADKSAAAEGIFAATGFDDAMRAFVFGNVCDTFKSIKTSTFKSMLNLENTVEYESFCHRNRSAIISVCI